MGAGKRVSDGAVSFELRVLGGVALKSASGEDAGVPRGKPMAMVSYLAMNPDGAERDCLARLLWSGADTSKGRHSVRQALSRLRQAVGAEALVGSDPIRLAPGLITVDVDVLRAAVASSRITDRLVRLRLGSISMLYSGYIERRSPNSMHDHEHIVYARYLS